MLVFARLLGGLSIVVMVTAVVAGVATPWLQDGGYDAEVGHSLVYESFAEVDAQSFNLAKSDTTDGRPVDLWMVLEPSAESASTTLGSRPIALQIAFDPSAVGASGSNDSSTTSSVPPTTTSSVPPRPTSTVGSAPATTATTIPQSPVGAGGSSGPITVTESGTVIENVHFTGSGNEHCVMINGAHNVTVRNSRFTNCYKGVYAVNASNVVVTDNVFEANMSGRGRNAVQFDKVSGGYVARNRSTVTNGATQSEDHISIYKSSGTSSNPIVVEGNVLVGGGPSTSGSGIMLGDNGGSWQVARNNVLRDPGQVGIGASGGSHITVTGNTVTSSSFSWSNVGIYAWDWDGSGCSNVTISGNEVTWVNASGSQNAFWDGQNCSNLTVTNNSWQ